MSQSISLCLLCLPQLIAIRSGEKSVDGIDLVEGALPPDFIIQSAIKELEASKEPAWYSFFLFVTDENQAVGSGGFRGQPENGRVEVGYGVAKSFQGQGVATRAIAQVVEFAFKVEQNCEVFAETSVTNIASRRVVEKVGFQPIGQRDTASDGVVDQWLLKR